MTEQELLNAILKVTKGNKRKIRFSNVFTHAKQKPMTVPVLTEGNVEIFFETSYEGNVEYYAHIKGEKEYYLIKNIEIVHVTSELYDLSDTTYSTLTAKMFDTKPNIERYIEVIQDIFPEDFDPNLLLSRFIPKKIEREKLKESIDPDAKETIIKTTDTYTVYLWKFSLKDRRNKLMPIPSKYAIVIEIEELADPHILFAWALKIIEKNLQTLF